MWALICYYFFGLFSAFSDEPKTIPDYIVTKKFIALAIPIIFILLIEFSIKSLLYKLKKKEPSSDKTILDPIFAKYNSQLEAWATKNVPDHAPNLKEEYVFFRSYYKYGKLFLKHKIIEEHNLPTNLDGKFKEAKRNYLMGKLSGII